jgi:2'-5' RNA ligase
MAPNPAIPRLFVALPLPEAVRTMLAGVRRDLEAAGLPLRWARPEGLHVTLNFLGERPAAVVEPVRTALERAAGDCPRLDLAVQGLGCFPEQGRPRVLWAGLAGDVARLDRLHRDIGREVRAAGVAFERQPFRPHVTLGRARAPLGDAETDRLRSFLTRPAPPPARWTAEAVVLLRSELGPGGSVYHTVARAALGGAPASRAGGPAHRPEIAGTDDPGRSR